MKARPHITENSSKTGLGVSCPQNNSTIIINFFFLNVPFAIQMWSFYSLWLSVGFKMCWRYIMWEELDDIILLKQLCLCSVIILMMIFHCI